MISPKFLWNPLVPCKWIFSREFPILIEKYMCIHHRPFAADRNIIAANEGAAVGLAAGYYLLRRENPGCLYAEFRFGQYGQPLMSLTDKEVYNIPSLFLIGWRGEPSKDEPQHIKQGKVTLYLKLRGNKVYCLISG